MLANNLNIDFSSPVRHIDAGVELYSTPSNTLETIFGPSNNLISFQVDRTGESSKFFGFGFIHKAEIKLLPDYRLQKGKELKIFYMGESPNEWVEAENAYPYPTFKIDEITKDENTGDLTITAYDKLHEAAAHTIAEVDLPSSYTLGEIASACASLLGLTMTFSGMDSSAWSLSYPEGANLDGAETIRKVLDAIAEASQTIYFADADDNLVFKSLVGTYTHTITKADYVTLKSGETHRLAAIAHFTELGDNITVESGENGVTQYIRNNPFLELREDLPDVLSYALDNLNSLRLCQFDLAWRGHPLLELGDTIKMEDKDGNYITSCVLNDAITYNGGLSQKTSWSYENTTETASNPASLGDLLTQTYAKVDKANKQVEIVVSEVGENTASISAIQSNIDSISASVTQVQNAAETSIEGLSESVAALQTDVSNFKLQADSALLEFKRELEADGVDKITTSTGFSFDSDGLNISKSGSEINTTITEDGMTIRRYNEVVLVADNQGVRAEDLHATTYLIIGSTSRFEDYQYGARTGCFWIGG